MKYWEVKAKANKTGELLLYGEIASSQFWGDEVTPTQIDAEIKALGEIDTLNVYINSGGGSVFAGMAIYNIIKRCKASVKNAYVDGLAASIASVIPMACDKVFIPSNAVMMIHNPAGAIMGCAEEMRKMAEILDKLRETISNVYAEKTGMGKEELHKMMDEEKWMTAAECLEMGFCDEMQAEVKIAASVDTNFLNFGDVKIDTSHFKNFKPEIIEIYGEEIQPVIIEDKIPEKTELKLSEQENAFRALKIKLTKI